MLFMRRHLRQILDPVAIFLVGIVKLTAYGKPPPPASPEIRAGAATGSRPTRA